MSRALGTGPDPPAAARSAPRVRATARGRLPAVVLLLVVGYLVLSPLGFLVVSSLKPTGLPFDPGWTVSHLTDVYRDARTYDLLATTLVFVAGSTLLALAVTVPIAWLVERTDLPWRRVLRALVVLPMAVPPLLTAIAWVLLASPRTGVLNDLLAAVLGSDVVTLDPFGLPGMIAVQALTVVPSTFLLLSPAFRGMDPALEEAALASGASVTTALRRIVLPVLRPALLAAGTYVAIVGFVVFDVPGTLGLPVRISVLSTEIYRLALTPTGGLPEYGRISALAAIFLVALVGLALAYQRLTRRSSSFVTVTGRPSAGRQLPLARWRWPAAALVGAYVLLAVGAPIAILTWTSLLPYQAGVSAEMLSQVTLANHVEFLGNGRILDATANSVVVAVVAATAVAVLSALVSWVVVRSRAPGRRVLDVLAFLPLAMPGVMVGLALVFVYLTVTILPIYGTVWILVVAYTTTYLAFGSRVTHGVLHQLGGELEDAAATSGAGWSRTMRRIVLPLAAPGIVAVWIWVLAHALRELSTALLLQGRDNTVVSTLLWDYWTSGEQATAAAVGVWLVAALLALVTVWQVVAARAGVQGAGAQGVEARGAEVRGAEARGAEIRRAGFRERAG